jgi:hypothetical protein
LFKKEREYEKSVEEHDEIYAIYAHIFNLHCGLLVSSRLEK